MTREHRRRSSENRRRRRRRSSGRRRHWHRNAWRGGYPYYRHGGLASPYYYYHGGLAPPYYAPPAAPLYGFSTSDACLKHGEGRQVLFLEQNCAGFPTGPICCPQQQDVVYCQGNVGGGMSVGTLQCFAKD